MAWQIRVLVVITGMVPLACAQAVAKWLANAAARWVATITLKSFRATRGKLHLNPKILPPACCIGASSDPPPLPRPAAGVMLCPTLNPPPPLPRPAAGGVPAAGPAERVGDRGAGRHEGGAAVQHQEGSRICEQVIDCS